jgi:hypothetical protein
VFLVLNSIELKTEHKKNRELKEFNNNLQFGDITENKEVDRHSGNPFTYSARQM